MEDPGVTRARFLFAVVAVVVVAGALGAVAGAGGTLDLVDDHHELVLSDETVGYRRCPADESTLAVFRGGDRVYAVGRTDDGSWIAVRAPTDLSVTVWVPEAALDPDADLGTLPVLGCTDPESGDTSPKGSIETTSTAPATTGGVDTAPPTTAFPATTGAPDSSPSTTGQPSTTTSVLPSTTGPPDTEGPSIGPIEVEPARVFEDGPDCVRLARTATVRVRADDPAGVTRVVLRWSVGEAQADVSLEGGPVYQGTIGPIPIGTVEATTPVELVVEAVDGAGNRSLAVSESVLALEPC